MQHKNTTFGDRLREIRKEQGLSQEEFAKKLGTSKQVLSRYETKQRAPKITIAAAYAEKLNVSLDYLMGDTVAETDFHELSSKNKPFYKIFIDVTEEMGFDIPAIVRVTGLTDSQARAIILKRMKDAPLSLALLLSDTLGVPLEVWTGDVNYKPVDISVEAREVALAYDKADEKSKNIARSVLDLEVIPNKK